MSTPELIFIIVRHRPKELNLKRKVKLFMKHILNAIWEPKSGKRLLIELGALLILSVALKLAGITK